MKEKIKMELLGRKPEHIKGRVRIDLTDPVTGKVKERIEGDNHAFQKSLFAGVSYDWVSAVSLSWLCLNDSTIALDTSIPYLMGQTIAYGRPSQGSSGAFRGAYNTVNQVLAQMSLDKVRWKFQYDFTTAQGNSGTIRNIGLTHQYANNTNVHTSGFRIPVASSGLTGISDGRYSYSCSTGGIVTKADVILSSSSTIDKSAVTGTTAGDTKTIGYNPSNGKYYIYVYSSTAGNRKLYEFSDSTFATLSNTYSISNIAITGTLPLYIYGNYMFAFTGSNTIYQANYVSNTAFTTITATAYNNAAYTESTTYASGSFNYGTVAKGNYVYCLANTNSSVRKGIIFDLSSATVAGYISGPYNPGAQTTGTAIFHPVVTTEALVCDAVSVTIPCAAAITTYILPTPVTKTTANGMTATYELEVYWV